MFKGVKLIPPGSHYVYYSLEDEEYAQRMGFFIYVRENGVDRQDVIVRKWNEQEQMFERVAESEDLAYAESVRNMDFDKYLGAYPLENHQQWVGLSNFISKEVIDRLDSLNHYVLSEAKERDLRGQEEHQQA